MPADLRMKKSPKIALNPQRRIKTIFNARAPLQTKLALTGQMPNRVETLSMVLTALLVAVTYFLKYLGYKKS